MSPGFPSLSTPQSLWVLLFPRPSVVAPTAHATHSSSLMLLKCWHRGVSTALALNFSPQQSWKCPVSECPEGGDYTESLCFFIAIITLFFKKQDCYPATTSIPCESNLQTQQLLTVQDVSLSVCFLNHKYYKF